jgi:putative NADPH-quinone reductase
VKVLVVFDHPRRHSFCGAVLDEFIAGLAEAGHEVEIADLHAEGFDPRMPEAAVGAERRQSQLREVRALGRSLAVQPA